jgi:hypothetical protein
MLLLFNKRVSEELLGWHKDPYNPTARYHKMAVAPTLIPDVGPTDMVKFTPPVRFQEASDCTGFGIGGKLTATVNRLGLTLSGGVQYFSPTDIYNGARFIEGDLQYDDGAYPDDCYQWLMEKGCLPEGYWKYIGFEKRSRPSALDVEAAKYPLLNVFRVVNGVDGICSAIAEGNYVSNGSPWPQIWMSSKDGVLATPKLSDKLAGGHEYYIYNFNRIGRVFYCINSWGTDRWSYSGRLLPKGHFTISFASFDYFKYQGGYDAHYAKVVWSSAPQPTPAGRTIIRLSKGSESSDLMETLYEGKL